MMNWFMREARWWQVWYPQSGATGGGIIGIAILTATYVFLSIYR